MFLIYRPISVVSAVAKIYEKLVYMNSCLVLLNNMKFLLAIHVRGFRKKYSTETALIFNPLASEHGQRFGKRCLLP